MIFETTSPLLKEIVFRPCAMLKYFRSFEDLEYTVVRDEFSKCMAAFPYLENRKTLIQNKRNHKQVIPNSREG